MLREAQTHDNGSISNPERPQHFTQSSADMTLPSEVREGERWLLRPKRCLLRKGGSKSSCGPTAEKGPLISLQLI